MSLPTAPLGELPSMNMPYSIPTYDKGPSLWEKALSAFLVNAAGGVAQRGAENVMSRDHAAEFGEKPATGFSRLLGPRVDDATAKQRRQNEFVAQEGGLDREAARQRIQDEFMSRNDMAVLDARNQGLRDDSRFTHDSDMAALEAQNRSLGTDREIEANMALAELKAMLQSQDPGNMAQARRDNAAADELQSKAEFNRSFQQGGAGGGSPVQADNSGVDPSVAAFASGLNPRQQALQDFLASSEGQTRYPPEGRQAPPSPTSSDVPLTNERIREFLARRETNPGLTLEGYDPESPLELLRSMFGYRNQTHIGP